MYARFAWLTTLNLLFTLVAYVAAPFVVPFASSDGYLPKWLRWFQTFDASLDAGWRDGYFEYSGEDVEPLAVAPTGWELYWLRVRWLWRNPGYGFCYWPLGLDYDPSDWFIKKMSWQDSKLIEFYAVTKDGKNFCYTNANGVKLGYKLWWALDEALPHMLIPRLPVSRGPDNRLPIAFTPRL